MNNNKIHKVASEYIMTITAGGGVKEKNQLQQQQKNMHFNVQSKTFNNNIVIS